MNDPTLDVGATDQKVVTTPKSNTVVLGASMPYDSLKALEHVMISDPKLNILRVEGFRPNKTDLVKMSLLLFFNTPISKDRLLSLWGNANNDRVFQGAEND